MKLKLLKTFFECILTLIWVMIIVSIYEGYKEGLWTIMYFFVFFYIIFFAFDYIIGLVFFKKTKDLIHSRKTLSVCILILMLLIIISLLYKENIPFFLVSIITNIFSSLFALNLSKLLLRKYLL